MNKILYIILFSILSISSYSQDYIVSVVQDYKLATQADDYGNKPFTLDMVVKGKVYGKWLHATIGYEHASLSSGSLDRISIGGGIHYQYDRFEISQEINYGMLIRPFSNSFGLGADTEFALEIVDWLKMIAVLQFINRTDYNKDFIRFSGQIGIGVKVWKK